MPRGKAGRTSATATATPHARLAKLAKRKETLRNKAGELVTRCNVDVAVVCTGPGGVGDLDCWPSKAAVDAVVRRYNALEPAERARLKEDLADLVASEVAKEREKLTRTRESGLANAFGSYDGSLEGMSEEKLRELLASIEGALVAARGRALKLRAPPGGAADRATLSPGLVHDHEAAEEDSASATNNVVPPPTELPRGEADAGGGGLGPPPSGKDPNPPNAVPVDTGEEEVVAENIVTGEDPGDEVQILQPPGDADADADDAEWMRSLVDDLKKKPQPHNPAGIEYINVGNSWMERDAYDFIRFDLGMPPPGVAPRNYLDDGGDGEPLKLWSWDNTMPHPPK
ncbi:hypothetical protein BDA96_03G429800 [Sorghum bicolor]|jgi:hypothetical protein|uniref:MADS-box domain-containing protein n=1 Tax=Sorghum bicolor TaxID=4558 RepID=A0A921RJ00_SORBI|nr:hypothetical protein BDA96_03G429800 [Sorghum bicolor]